MVSISSVMTYFINKLLIAIETTATAAAVFGAYYKLQSFVFMPVFGLTNAMIPIIGYNLGAGNKHRMLKTYRLSVMYALIVMILGMAAMLFLPNVLLSFFNASSMMMQIGEPALRIICLSIPFAAFGIVAGSFFQACGNGLVAACSIGARSLYSRICCWRGICMVCIPNSRAGFVRGCRLWKILYQQENTQQNAGGAHKYLSAV